MFFVSLCDYKDTNILSKNMKRYRLFIFAVSLASIFATTACCNCRQSRKLERPLVGTEWQLVQIMARDVAATADSYTMLFASDGTMSGVGDCNRFTAAYTTDASRNLRIENLGSTRRLCPDADAETAFFDMLEDVTHYEMDASMMLMLSNGTLVAIFKSLPAE